MWAGSSTLGLRVVVHDYRKGVSHKTREHLSPLNFLLSAIENVSISHKGELQPSEKITQSRFEIRGKLKFSGLFANFFFFLQAG